MPNRGMRQGRMRQGRIRQGGLRLGLLAVLLAWLAACQQSSTEPPPAQAPATSAAVPPPPPPIHAAGGVSEMVITGSHTPGDQRYTTVRRSVAGSIPVPAMTGDERYENEPTNPVHSVAETPVSTFSIDVDTAAYANVRRMLQDGALPPKDAVRVEELVNYFEYDYAPPAARTQPFSTTVSVLPAPWAEGRQLLHIGLQGYTPPAATRPPLNLVLLVDTSGSMAGPNRLGLAVQGFRMLLESLDERARLAIVVYAGAAGAVLEPTRGDDQVRIRAALGNLQAGGSTAGGAGLELAYALARKHFDPRAVNRVIMATDGDFNVGISDPDALQSFVAAQRAQGIYLSVLGFGGGNYNDALMQRLAQNGNGVAAYIDGIAEARRVLSEQASSALIPIADDVKIQVEFNPAQVAEYRLIGYESRMLRREDFNNDAVDAGEIGAGHSVTALYEITPVGGPLRLEPLRYAQPAQAGAPRAGASTPAARAGELALLRIRYKLPGERESRLIERPIVRTDVVADMARAPESSRWAAAVAAFGQRLRGDAYLRPGYGWTDIIDLAQGARGQDEFGWRAEFVQLVRAAASADGSLSDPAAAARR